MSEAAPFEPAAGLQNNSSPKLTQEELRNIALVDSIMPGATDEEIKQGDKEWEAYLKTHASITSGRLRGANGRFTTKEAAASFYHKEQETWTPEPSAEAQNFVRKVHLIRDKYLDVPAPVKTQVVRVVPAQETPQPTVTARVIETPAASPTTSSYEPTPIFDDLMRRYGQALPNRTIRLIPEPVTELHGLHRPKEEVQKPVVSGSMSFLYDPMLQQALFASATPEQPKEPKAEPQQEVPADPPAQKPNAAMVEKMKRTIEEQVEDAKKSQEPPITPVVPVLPPRETIQAEEPKQDPAPSRPATPPRPPQGNEKTKNRERGKYTKRLAIAALAVGALAALAWMGNKAVDGTNDTDGAARPPQNPAATASPTPGKSPAPTVERPNTTNNDRPVIKLSKAARTVEPGEGFYQTFKEMGVPAAERPRLLQKVGPVLAKMGLAYKTPDGLWGISKPGQLPEKIVDEIQKKR